MLVNNMLLYNVKEFTYLNHLYLQVPLGIICRNENKSEEMIAILEEIHNKYLPCLDDDEATKKVTGNNEMHSVNHDNAVDRQTRKHVTHLNVWSNEYTFLSSGVSILCDLVVMAWRKSDLFQFHHPGNSCNLIILS